MNGQKIADITGCTRAAIHSIASGKTSKPSLELAVALDEKLGIAVRMWLQPAMSNRVDESSVTVSGEAETPRDPAPALDTTRKGVAA
jgi:transcriptional regulator with XRE-family HTH domain